MLAMINDCAKGCFILSVINCLISCAGVLGTWVPGDQIQIHTGRVPTREEHTDIFISLRARLSRVHIVANVSDLAAVPTLRQLL